MMDNFTMVNFIISLIIVAALVAGIVYAIRRWRTARRERAQGSSPHTARPTSPR
ncbi:hypothetical protein [Microbacterium hydrothermale]|uniref:hypothetical protein n=1 Tax=Microbacterium hydrothermale TaxID=857427 RepID=UPI00142D8829|nr:hypothetical protein [Microbacterium hydrothermale]